MTIALSLLMGGCSRNPTAQSNSCILRVVQGKLRKEGETWSLADFEKKIGNLKSLAEELRSFQNDLRTIKFQVPEGEFDWATSFSTNVYARPTSAALIDFLSQSKWVPGPPDKPES
jgi:hypothetical protein